MIRNLGALRNERGYRMRERFWGFDRDRAIFLSMNRASNVIIWLSILAVAAVAIGVTGSVWGGVVVAALELGLVGLLRIRHQPR